MPSKKYTAIFEYFDDEDAKGFKAIFPAFPGVVTWGRTIEEARVNAQEALQCHIEGILKDGGTIPDENT
jgi:predicted RNase H-like HicB family nuclease